MAGHHHHETGKEMITGGEMTETERSIMMNDLERIERGVEVEVQCGIIESEVVIGIVMIEGMDTEDDTTCEGVL